MQTGTIYNTNDCKINVNESTVSTKHGIVDLIVCSGRGGLGISCIPGKCSLTELLFQFSPVVFNKDSHEPRFYID